jgi:hypothetical protein
MIYFITDGALTKVGKSKNPLSRGRALQTSNGKELEFLYCFDINDSYEKTIQRYLYEHLTNSTNEWFDLRGINLEKFLISLELDIKNGKQVAKEINSKFLKNIVLYMKDDGSFIIDHNAFQRQIEIDKSKGII